jgi:hypothetical protein
MGSIFAAARIVADASKPAGAKTRRSTRRKR